MTQVSQSLESLLVEHEPLVEPIPFRYFGPNKFDQNSNICLPACVIYCNFWISEVMGELSWHLPLHNHAFVTLNTILLLLSKREGDLMTFFLLCFALFSMASGVHATTSSTLVVLWSCSRSSYACNTSKLFPHLTWGLTIFPSCCNPFLRPKTRFKAFALALALHLLSPIEFLTLSS